MTLLWSCSLPDYPENQGGLAITWDVENRGSLAAWYEDRDHVNRFGVPFTFYVCVPTLSDEDVAILKEFRQDGHEIGFHSRSHMNPVSYIYVKGHTIDEYLNLEIIPGIEDFQSHDLELRSYAFPSAQHFTKLDNRLYEYFDSLRSVTLFIDWCFYKFDAKRMVYAYWIDHLSMLDEQEQINQIFLGLEQAKKRGWVLILYGHRIGSGNTPNVTASTKLERIIEYARQLDLTFYRMSDLYE